MRPRDGGLLSGKSELRARKSLRLWGNAGATALTLVHRHLWRAMPTEHSNSQPARQPSCLATSDINSEVCRDLMMSNVFEPVFIKTAASSR